MKSELTEETLPANFRVTDEVRAALDSNRAVVALETSVLAHGMAHPYNIETYRRVLDCVRAHGAVPAPILVAEGSVHVGATLSMLEAFAAGGTASKIGEREIALATVSGREAATTVSATMACAVKVGIEVFATGGIGGVHRDVLETFDISSDLMTLSRTPVTVVCSGAKSILDLARTMEWLESLGVPVVGYGTDKLPAFYLRESNIDLDYSFDDIATLARMVRMHRELSTSGIVVVNPIPAAAAIDAQALEGWTRIAMDRAEAEGVSGKAVTPFLLKTVAALSDGATLAANASLLLDNARVASELATALATKGATKLASGSGRLARSGAR